ncbi:MAG: hypothetical protein H3C34_19490 [Caldilineaceae bacterium]|nr:hypothetical protein [Caldilineaceae bacterium]
MTLWYSSKHARTGIGGGVCPFCHKPVPRENIASPCSHYAGSDSPEPRQASHFPIVEGSPFDLFCDYVDAIADFASETQQTVLSRLSPKARALISEALRRPVMAAFWKAFVPHKAVSVREEVGGAETTTVLYFVADLTAARATLAKQIEQTLAEMA